MTRTRKNSRIRKTMRKKTRMHLMCLKFHKNSCSMPTRHRSIPILSHLPVGNEMETAEGAALSFRRTVVDTSNPCFRKERLSVLRSMPPSVHQLLIKKARRERAIGTKYESRGVHIEQGDVRIKKMARKAGSLIIFIVDASG